MEVLTCLRGVIQTRSLQPSEIHNAMLNLCQGLAFIHGLGVIHFNVHPGHLGVVANEQHLIVNLKLLDFGSAALKDTPFRTGITKSALPYRALELLNGQAHCSEVVDVWSAGVVLWEMATRSVLFTSQSKPTLVTEIQAKIGVEMHGLQQLPSWSDFVGLMGKGGQSLLQRMLTIGPAERISATSAHLALSTNKTQESARDARKPSQQKCKKRKMK